MTGGGGEGLSSAARSEALLSDTEEGREEDGYVLVPSSALVNT